MTEAERRERFELLLDASTYERAWRYCCRLSMQAGGGSADAEDLLQEALTRGYLAVHTLRDESSFAGWLLAIVRRLHLNRLRRQQRQMQEVADPSSEASFVAAYEPQSAEAQQALDALARLPKGPRELLMLTCLDGLSPAEAASVLRIPARSIRMRLHRARKLLRAAYAQPGIPIAEQCSGRTT